MAACVLPSELAALVPDDLTNPDCETIRRILTEWTNLVADQQACKYKENGDLTEEYAQMVCDVNCP